MTQALTKSYAQKWPSYCQNCNGYGGAFEKFDPSPGGVSLSPGYLVEICPCPECLEQGICPRCAQPIETDHCYFCDWDLDCDHGIPDQEIWI
jgi:hypothetical protein